MNNPHSYQKFIPIKDPTKINPYITEKVCPIELAEYTEDIITFINKETLSQQYRKPRVINYGQYEYNQKLTPQLVQNISDAIIKPSIEPISPLSPTINACKIICFGETYANGATHQNLEPILYITVNGISSSYYITTILKTANDRTKGLCIDGSTNTSINATDLEIIRDNCIIPTLRTLDAFFVLLDKYMETL